MTKLDTQALRAKHRKITNDTGSFCFSEPAQDWPCDTMPLAPGGDAT